jgi:hypothetical protein
MMLTTHPHLVPKLRMSKSYTSSHPMRLHGVQRDHFTFTFPIFNREDGRKNRVCISAHVIVKEKNHIGVKTSEKSHLTSNHKLPRVVGDNYSADH